MKIIFEQRIIRDEDEAIDNLQKVYTGVIRTIICPILMDEHKVEECLNDIWLKISRHLEKVYGFEEKVRIAYICSTAKNAALDIRRKQEKEIPVGSHEDIREFAVNEGTHLYGTVKKHDLSDEVEEAFMQLKPIDREIIKLHHFYGFTYREIAEDLGMTEARAAKRGHRAEDKLRKIIRRKGGNQDEK